MTWYPLASLLQLFSSKHLPLHESCLLSQHPTGPGGDEGARELGEEEEDGHYLAQQLGLSGEQCSNSSSAQ